MPKKSNLAKILGLILAGSSTMLSGQDIPKSKIRSNIFENKEYARAAELGLKQGIDDIIASGFLNPDYASKIKGIKIKLCHSKGNKHIGLYNPKDNSIEVYLDDKTDSAPSYAFMASITNSIARDTVVHELAHDYFQRFLTPSQQNEFRQRIKQYVRSLKKINAKLSNSNENIPKSILQIHGFTKQSYENFKDFMKQSDKYRQIYGPNFETMFYGTEAFAQLAGHYLTGLLFARQITDNGSMNQESQDILDKLDIKIATDTLNSMSGIPYRLITYFSGFISKRILLE